MCQGYLCVFLAMEEDSTVPDFRDIEVKLGRKVPESLARSITHKPVESSRAQGHCRSSELQQLESKMLFLKQEMVRVSLICASCTQEVRSEPRV